MTCLFKELRGPQLSRWAFKSPVNSLCKWVKLFIGIVAAGRNYTATFLSDWRWKEKKERPVRLRSIIAYTVKKADTDNKENQCVFVERRCSQNSKSNPQCKHYSSLFFTGTNKAGKFWFGGRFFQCSLFSTGAKFEYGIQRSNFFSTSNIFGRFFS